MRIPARQKRNIFSEWRTRRKELEEMETNEWCNLTARKGVVRAHRNNPGPCVSNKIINICDGVFFEHRNSRPYLRAGRGVHGPRAQSLSLSLSPALVLALVSLARVLVVEALNGRGPDCQQKRRTKRVLSKTEHGQRCETEFLCAESLLVIRYNLLSATAVERPVRFPMPAHRKSATKEAVMAPWYAGGANRAPTIARTTDDIIALMFHRSALALF